ncbi:ATP-dependent Clp protease proteolytic subunit 4, chloroplastic [Oryza brachyantha]|uniref:ATP-dependent Clp protease proteolytic subunit n=1 Tax=Oryza brachyantha TaxID=4533 RepID=J3N5A6_ORYBR|nr:ATP-dependent Clp protease proteolytic subunit 4, chloroplastic [Oryza brachyantha]
MAAASATASLSAAVASHRPRHQRRLSALPRAPAPPPRSLRLNSLNSPRVASSPSLWEASVRAESDSHGAGGGGDVMGLLLRERIVFLGNEIEDFLADAVVSQLLLLDAVDPDSDIRLFVNSPGGSLSATMAIYDVMQLVRADVSTVGLGIAGSTASIILGGGTKGKRFAMPNTRIMIHQPVGGASGQALDVEVQAKEILTNKRNVIRLISGFTGRTPEQVEKDIDRDRYMGPLEAVDYGLIDGVIDGDSIIPLEPVPERVKPKYNYDELYKDPQKFLTPDVPDDEIY